MGPMKIRRRRLLWFATLLCASGCLYHVREHTDDVLNELTMRPYDLAPAAQTEPLKTPSGQSAPGETPLPAPKKAVGADGRLLTMPQVDVQTTAFLQQTETDTRVRQIQERMSRLKIPEAVPGSETPLIIVPKETAAQQTVIKRIYPELPPLPVEPKALPGPNGQPYTLAALQSLAAANSPQSATGHLRRRSRQRKPDPGARVPQPDD